MGEASLPDPQSLLRAPAYPPAGGLQVGQIQKQARFRKNAWVWEHFDKRPVPAAGAAAAGGDQEMAEEEEAAAAPAAAAMEVKYACKHCPNVRSAHEAGKKEHLLNIEICGFLSSTAAADCPAEEVQSKLKSLRQSSSSTTQHQGRFEGSNFNFDRGFQSLDRTARRTVFYRIYGLKPYKYGCTPYFCTVPYNRTPYRTP